MALYYSKISDYQVEDGVLNVYLPLTKETMALYQVLSDIMRPSREYFDNQTEGTPLVAVEWFFPKGVATLKKVEKMVAWREMFSTPTQNQTV